jgi:hypothetical protein
MGSEGGEAIVNYLLLICADDKPGRPEDGATIGRVIHEWVDEMDGRGVRVFGHELKGPATATTVRVRDGQTLLSDGPFTEVKEFIAGFDLITCADLDEAIEIAAKHPMSWFHQIEIRPFLDGPDVRCEFAVREGGSGPRYLLMMCLDGIPGSDEEEQSIRRDGDAWVDGLRAHGGPIFSHALAHAKTATTVKVRDGDTLLTDGPFTETKEFIGGLAIVEAASTDEAIEIAAKHPLARFHMIEVRGFAEYGTDANDN